MGLDVDNWSWAPTKPRKSGLLLKFADSEHFVYT